MLERNIDVIRVAMEEKTLILIKPEGVQKGLLAEITSRLTQKGLKQVAVKTVRDLDDIKKMSME